MITVNSQYLPYELQDVEDSVFKIEDDIDKIHLADGYVCDNLNDYLANDLIGFSTILKYYNSNISLSYLKDMDTSREPNLKECAAEFHHKIISNKNITKDVRHALIQTGKATNQALGDLDTVYNRYKKI